MADHVYVKIDIRCIDAAICQSKFVKAKLDDDIGRVISVLLEESGKSDAVQISRIESRGTDIDPKTPISVLKDFGCKTISAWVCKLEQDSNNNNKPTQGKSIFDVLMTATRSYTQYPAQRRFWYLDPHHEKFQKRGLQLPKLFKDLSGYRDLKVQHKKIPQVTSIDLKENAQNLSSLLTIPWMMNPQFKELYTSIEDLISHLKKYEEYLCDCNKKMKANHESTVPIRDLKDNWILRVIESVENVPVEYKALDLCVKDLAEYQPIDLIRFEPNDKEERRKWIKHLSLSSSVALYSFQYGNYLGNMNVLWKLPESTCRDTVKQVKVIDKIKRNILKFSTRKMQKDFIDRYKFCIGLQPVILRNMYSYLTEFEYQANSANASQIDERFMKFLLDSEDCELIFDLRKNNCRPAEEKFKPFWKELGKFFDEKAAVHERRSNDRLYLPFAISVDDLRSQILDRLPEGSEAPSVSWIKLNFSPSNVYNTTAKNYTGQYNVRFAVQQRLVRVQHPDSHYCAVLFSMLKEFACRMRDFSTFQCMDDKAIIPLGEPGHPVSTGVRAHHGGLVGGCMKVVALDHDFHVGGIIPSVCFVNDIPENPKDSFYNGLLNVTVKDKVFQASSPLRHSTENVSLMRQCNSVDDMNLRTPVLIRYTDGGPDHRTTYKSVKLCALMEFIALDLDMIVCARTAPCGSYANPAERTMSLLNLALQNVALERAAMSPECEMQVKSASSFKKLRNLGSKNQKLKEEYTQAVEVSLNILRERFKHLRWKGENVCVHDPASQEEMYALVEMLKVLDENIHCEANLSTLQSKAIDAFLESHSRSRQYSFQIKKCMADNCGYCVLNPPRLPDDVFRGLHFVPDPTQDENGQYKDFQDLYGTETNDMNRPSMTGKHGESSERDKKFKAVLVGTKVRGFVLCTECGKRRVIYASRKLNRTEERAVERVQEELLYICGNPLFPGGQYQDVILCRQNISCSSPIETQYYSGKTQIFDAVCFHCGDPDVTNCDEVRRLQEDFAIVRPICGQCLQSGKQIPTRNAKKRKN